MNKCLGEWQFEERYNVYILIMGTFLQFLSCQSCWLINWHLCGLVVKKIIIKLRENPSLLLDYNKTISHADTIFEVKTAEAEGGNASYLTY